MNKKEIALAVFFSIFIALGVSLAAGLIIKYEISYYLNIFRNDVAGMPLLCMELINLISLVALLVSIIFINKMTKQNIIYLAITIIISIISVFAAGMLIHYNSNIENRLLYIDNIAFSIYAINFAQMVIYVINKYRNNYINKLVLSNKLNKKEER